MDTPERTSVRQALDALKPFLESYLAQRISLSAGFKGPPGSRPDIQALLRTCLDHWEGKLSRELPRTARAYVHELIDIRNRWAHEVPFSASEAARARDTAHLFGSLIGAPMTPATTVRTAPREPAPARRSRRETQRDVMIRVFAATGGDSERAILAYAAAEEAGEVARKSNRHGLDAEVYARALLNDGLKKGWLTPP